ncbi:MAG TPA: molecular chaperone TorD family protein [Rhodocyclaceae bacterium]|nr:molecular chaperone TorD family protein [Rhodocyclaceae bacterium]
MNANTEIRDLVPDGALKAAARSRAYGLLARAFRYPETEAFEDLADGTYAEALRSALEGSFPAVMDEFDTLVVPWLSVAGGIEDFEAAYLAAFENDAPRPSVSLYEGSFGEQRNEKPRLLLELKAFYRNFGLAMAANDMEDALAAELEFMQFLAAKQVEALEEGRDPLPYLHAQRDFLARHLSGWLPALAGELEAKLGEGLFTALGRLLSRYAHLDAAWTAAAFDSATAGP